MKKKLATIGVLSAAILLAACEGDDGRDGAAGAPGADGFNSLLVAREIPKGDADCPGGGQALDSGLDTNRNGVLDPSEVTATSFLECATAPRLRALHASPDAPAVNILVNGQEALSDVDYTQGSGFLPVAEETRVEVEAIIPGGNAVVIDANLSLDFSTDYTVIAIGNVAAPVAALTISNPTDQALTSGNFFAQVVHAAPAAPAVDIFVTIPDADLGTSTPVGTLDYTESTDRLEVSAGAYQIRVTLAGDAATVVFDSGALDLAADADLLIAAVENTGPGATPIQLVVLDGSGSADLLDVNTPAAVTAVHASPDAPAVDILADIASTPEDDALPLAVDYSFTQFCEIGGIPAPGEYTVSVVANVDNSVVATQFPFAAEQGAEATAIVTGFLSSGEPAIQPLALATDTRSVVTEAKLRVVHGSPSTGAVDLYLLPDGADLNDAAVTPSFGAVPFGADTGILSIAPGVYDVYVTPAGDKSVVAIELQDVALIGGEVLDVIARDPATDGSEGALPLPLVIDYAAVPACIT
jgi:trimeric autotransporter adhesin